MKVKIKMFKTPVPYYLFFAVSAFIIFALTASSCGNTNKPEDTKKTAEEHNDAKFDNKQEADAQFLVSAAEINMEEIQLGQLAQKNGMMAEVKELGKMMEADHSKALNDLQALAAKKQISLPASITDNGKDAYKKLMAKQGKDFDKEYCAMMVEGHKAAIEKFEKASTDAADPDIKNWATSMLPGLRAHLDHAITCQKKCENM